MGLCDVDVINRDANDINSHVLVSFEDILAEPEGARSSACVWKLSHCCFVFWKNLLYKLYTLFCGCCIAAYWGCLFAGVAFDQVWCITPVLKLLELSCIPMRKSCRLCLGCCCDPICESFGQIFYNFKRG